MASLSMNDIRLGPVISVNNRPYQVITARHVKMGRGGAVLKTKLKNVIDGSTLEQTFDSGSKISDADLARAKAQYLYRQGDTAVMMDTATFEQHELGGRQIASQLPWLREGQEVDVLLYNQKPVAIDVPVKVELKVVSAPPGVRGDTSGSATKVVILETGKEVRTPLFVKAGDIIRINTETGEYVERV